MNFDLYIKIPENIVDEGNPNTVFTYCQIFQLELRKRKYSLKKFSEDNQVSYTTCRRLQKVAKKMLRPNSTNQSNNVI